MTSAPTPSQPTFSPPWTAAAELLPVMQRQGYAVLDAASVAQLCQVDFRDLAEFQASWAGLPPDQHLKDGGRYRRRRHACFVVEGERCDAVAHRPHWQPLSYNALHGGMERRFEPMETRFVQAPAWARLVTGIGTVCDRLSAAAAAAGGPWSVEAHQFRIDTAGGIGRPTPEGAHRDGVDFVAVILIGRSGVKGGETRVFDAQGPSGQRFTLSQPWSMLLLDDSRVIHETTPIQPLDTDGWRDTLVLTYRRGGFQAAAPAAATVTAEPS
ncbi:MAG: hypothetical protein GAK30_03732 [Paracidovorax wautersii]|uniref:2OG-Fe dioxygenase n=1 Tax=Paracidovorax wautersii TaxID=1177982 RepID=A0A7V8FKJ4_9BURK|nr:MAG: hypothetical protein GAK30_03732 [Paracidovorax wautersii]